MPTPAELLTEIENGPLAATLAPLVSAGNDAGIVAALNERLYVGYVPIRDLSAYCVTQGITGGILAVDSLSVGQEIAPGVPMTLQIKGLLKTVLTVVLDDYRLEDADIALPEFVAALDGLIGLGLLTTTQKDAITAMGNNRRSRADVAFGDGTTISLSDVSEALRGVR